MGVPKQLYFFNTVLLGFTLLISFVTIAFTIEFLGNWTSSLNGGIESGSKVTFQYPVVFNSLLIIQDAIVAEFKEINSIYGSWRSLILGSDEVKHTIISSEHGVGLQSKEKNDFPIIQNQDGLFAYFSSHGSFISSLLFAQNGVAVESDERIKLNVTNANGKESLETILNIQTKEFRYTSKWLSHSNLTNSSYVSISGQDLENIKPQYVINQRTKFGNVKVDDFKTIRYDFIIGDLASAMKHFLRITAANHIRLWCFTSQLIGDPAIVNASQGMCNCGPPESTDMNCLCENMIIECPYFSGGYFPICHDDDPAFFYCNTLYL